MITEPKQPYFPPLYGEVDCGKCEIASECRCCNKYQRNRRDFMSSSGRCPRLPDYQGHVDKSQRELYARTFPLIHAERGEESLDMTLTVPGMKRPRKVYRTKYGSWYFREKKDEYGNYIRPILHFDLSHENKEGILRYMELYGYDYCIFRAEITDSFA